jgi:hypothetical protein
MTDNRDFIDGDRPVTPHATAEGLANANAMFARSDWDARGVTPVYLPRPIAERMLLQRGWTHDDARRPWRAPTGELVWDTDEAVRAALCAEILQPAGNRERTDVGAELLRDLINTILAHEALLDEVDGLLFEHVVEGCHRPAAVAAELRRLALDAVTGASPEDWQRIAGHLIADVRDLEPEARHNPKTDPPRASER